MGWQQRRLLHLARHLAGPCLRVPARCAEAHTSPHHGLSASALEPGGCRAMQGADLYRNAALSGSEAEYETPRLTTTTTTTTTNNEP